MKSSNMGNLSGEEKALALDRDDPLQYFREKFLIDDPFVIYLDGNSLGRLPLSSIRYLEQVVQDQWGTHLINSWNKDWYRKSSEIGDKIATIIGASPGEVIVSDNTSVNLYKLAFAALNYQKNRKVILTDEFNFPSDVYILQSIIQITGEKFHLELLKSEDGISVAEKELNQKINESAALLTLSHVTFKSAFMYDMKKVTQLAHEVGALMLWDLSHSAGVVPIELNACQVDLAVGCTYKYMNAGPGAPAFLYVRKDLQEKLTSPVWGWFGADDPFDFKLDYIPDKGIRKFLTGTPPIISLSAIEPGLDMILGAEIAKIRSRSIALSEYFIEQFNDQLLKYGFGLASPKSSDLRGSHVSLKHQEAFRIIKAMMDKSVDGYEIIPDFRPPDNIRFGFAPLYNSFHEIYITIKKLDQIVRQRLFENYDHMKEDVT